MWMNELINWLINVEKQLYKNTRTSWEGIGYPGPLVVFPRIPLKEELRISDSVR